MIFGIRAVMEAVEAGKDIDKVMVKRELSGELFSELQELLRLHEIPMQRVPLERIDRVTRKNHQGVIAFTSAVTYQKLEQIVPLLYEEGKNPFILVLDGLTDVRNFGAIARTCEVAGERVGECRRDEDIRRGVAFHTGVQGTEPQGGDRLPEEQRDKSGDSHREGSRTLYW